MKNNTIKVVFLSLILGMTTHLNSQDFTLLKSTIKFWVGNGADSSALIVTFNSSSFDSSFVWGILFDDSIAGSEILDLVANSDMNFAWTTAGQFLDSVSYGSNSGKNAVLGYYWGIYSYDSGWVSNSGLSTVVYPRDLFGLSFNNFSPEVKPGDPIPALSPIIISTSDWDDNSLRWFGEGNSRTILVVDFEPTQSGKSFAFGIKFDDSTTGLEILQAVASEDSTFRVNASSFLNDIIYQSDSGVGGNPNYWGTWSATNFGNWSLNNGVSQKITNGDFFACTYTDFAPPVRPTYPQIIEAPEKENISSETLSKILNVNIYPNPLQNILNIAFENEFMVEIRNTIGQSIFSSNAINSIQIESHSWVSGIYIVSISTPDGNASFKVIKN